MDSNEVYCVAICKLFVFFVFFIDTLQNNLSLSGQNVHFLVNVTLTVCVVLRQLDNFGVS